MNLTSFCDYAESEGYVEIGFSNVIEPYITMLKDSYTTQVLLSSVRLTDQNANILYQYIRKQISNGKNKSFDVYISDLKEELELYKVEDGEKFICIKTIRISTKHF